MCLLSLTLLCSTDPQSCCCVLMKSVIAVMIISFPALVAALVSKHPFTVRDTFPSYYNSNYVVWHSPLRLNVCPFSSSKHAFTGFCLCMTTASGSMKVFPSHTLPPRKINPLSRMRQWGWALTLRAVCNQHGVVEETPRDAVKPCTTQRHTERLTSPPSVWWVNVDGWCVVLRVTLHMMRTARMSFTLYAHLHF